MYTTLDMHFPPASTCVALGLFDGLHPGHEVVILSAVREARRRGLVPCVFTFTTGGALPLAKSRGDLMSKTLFLERLEHFGAACVIRPAFEEFRDLSPEAFVREILRERLGAAMVSCGENFRFGKGAAGDTAALRRICGDCPAVEVLPLVNVDGTPVSSSEIRAAIRAGEMERASLLLGRRFAIDFKVVHGRKLGRTLGAPTINQPFPDGFVEPKFGVYATLATVHGREHVAVTNVGVKPTVGSDRVLAETYIHGFSGDLYGESVNVSFLRFLRPEQKFDDIAALKEQILQDSETASRVAADFREG
jgi:riboflavin kinase/FMN adenylyltransferase